MRFNGRKLIVWALVITAAFWIATDPSGAASFVSDDVFGGLKTAAGAAATFASGVLN